jgi:hypothetical protein
LPWLQPGRWEYCTQELSFPWHLWLCLQPPRPPMQVRIARYPFSFIFIRRDKIWHGLLNYTLNVYLSYIILFMIINL